MPKLLSLNARFIFPWQKYVLSHQNQERLATPTQQEHIRQIFLNHGIKEEPVYDTYVEKYDWE